MTWVASAGRFSAYTWSICQFYKAYHTRSVGLDGIYLHDPTALVAVLAPQLFGWHDGAVRVSCEGVARGKTLMDTGAKKCVCTRAAFLGSVLNCLTPRAQLGGRERLEGAAEVQRCAVAGRACCACSRDAVAKPLNEHVWVVDAEALQRILRVAPAVGNLNLDLQEHLSLQEVLNGQPAAGAQLLDCRPARA